MENKNRLEPAGRATFEAQGSNDKTQIPLALHELVIKRHFAKVPGKTDEFVADDTSRQCTTRWRRLAA